MEFRSVILLVQWQSKVCDHPACVMNGRNICIVCTVVDVFHRAAGPGRRVATSTHVGRRNEFAIFASLDKCKRKRNNIFRVEPQSEQAPRTGSVSV
mmetsp:Transcript_4643/g.6962  ORF Transcript_4643/g.6962 Transcript_4643/m.6962 type:complete len:96 (-) Transcript_4643:2153-2440(-)